MYPRNAASPERIAVGAVIQISDGVVQTSGVTITVQGQGGAEATGGGTTAYGASGMVYYTPTQAETDFTSFTVIASKASCIPVGQTIVTTASSMAGRSVPDGGTVTDLTNAPTNGDFTATMKTSAETASAAAITAAALATAANLAAAKTVIDAIDGKTTNLPTDPADQSLIIDATNAIVALLGTPAGASIAADIATRLAASAYTAAPAASAVASQVRTELATELARIDATISSRLATAGYTAPDNASAATAASQATTAAANSTTILARLGAFTGTGINTILGFFRALMRKDAALTPTDVGGTFDNTTDSTEAIAEAGGGGGGGGGLTADQQAALTRIDRTVKGIASKRE